MRIKLFVQLWVHLWSAVCCVKVTRQAKDFYECGDNTCTCNEPKDTYYGYSENVCSEFSNDTHERNIKTNTKCSNAISLKEGKVELIDKSCNISFITSIELRDINENEGLWQGKWNTHLKKYIEVRQFKLHINNNGILNGLLLKINYNCTNSQFECYLIKFYGERESTETQKTIRLNTTASSNQSSTPPQKPPGENSTMLPIILGVVGCTVALTILIAVVVALLLRRKIRTKDHSRKRHPNPDEERKAGGEYDVPISEIRPTSLTQQQQQQQQQLTQQQQFPENDYQSFDAIISRDRNDNSYKYQPFGDDAPEYNKVDSVIPGYNVEPPHVYYNQAVIDNNMPEYKELDDLGPEYKELEEPLPEMPEYNEIEAPEYKEIGEPEYKEVVPEHTYTKTNSVGTSKQEVLTSDYNDSNQTHTGNSNMNNCVVPNKKPAMISKFNNTDSELKTFENPKNDQTGRLDLNATPNVKITSVKPPVAKKPMLPKNIHLQKQQQQEKQNGPRETSDPTFTTFTNHFDETYDTVADNGEAEKTKNLQDLYAPVKKNR